MKETGTQPHTVWLGCFLPSGSGKKPIQKARPNYYFCLSWTNIGRALLSS